MTPSTTVGEEVETARPTSIYAIPPGAPARLTTGPPILVTAISTEEEFDWAGPFRREATSVEAAPAIADAQAVFDEFGVRPVYLVDHPIATQRPSVGLLRGILESGRCEIGAHLHPWVSPPLSEELSPRNSFPCNLDPELEGEKLRVLVERIEESFGVAPRAYQAGRYGFGARTAGLLERHGFEVDLSASPPFDYRDEGGPDYSHLGCDPFWFGSERELLAVPLTGAYVGFLDRAKHGAYRLACRPWGKLVRLPGLLSRIGAVDRLRLSPEGFAHADHRRLVEFLRRDGTRVFVFSLHSPSLRPGCTPYVRDQAELGAFLASCRRFFEYFLGELGGRSMTPNELRRHLLDEAPPPAK